jgi:hypothetical protein
MELQELEHRSLRGASERVQYNERYQYFWNEYRNEQGTIYQWAFLPVGGFSVQF